ncbi:MAG TPA: pyridoxal-dependent decarboxylase [Verrucomicrobiae bacterium]|nr:pyridoxal-dependent decarboxylase [Verrucomicrobiae bacterium]
MDPAPDARVTLDPENWDEFRALAHQMIDDTVDYLQNVRNRPAWRPMPAEVRDSFRGSVPQEGMGAAAAYADFKERILPYPNGNIHPRFWGWVQGTGTPLGMMAEMLAAAMNPHMAGFNQAPALVEQQVVRWVAELMGYPENSSGVLVAGGTIANILGLAVARHAKCGFDVRQDGLQGSGNHAKLLVYGSTETHNWVFKGLEFMGLGRAAFRSVPVNPDYEIDLAALRKMLERDKAAGHLPICIIGSAGTVNTGATDNLESLAEIAREHNTWFHVDGAFGAWARISGRLKSLVAGLERSDSIGLDLHKWIYLPFECACVLVRDADLHQAAFASTASYLAVADRGVMAGGIPFANLGLDLTRGFKALKVWMAFKVHGIAHIARVIEQNVNDVQYLVKRIRQTEELELLAPVPLNIACFRYVRAGQTDEVLNGLNQEILLRVQEQGIAIPSGTTLNGKFAIRVANTNHRTRREDFDGLLAAVIRLGGEV